jgi:acyl carrier protein|tara:strand:- start:201 stop:482 length:282 start_codon:yes stop_codon:yes gene_type:complete
MLLSSYKNISRVAMERTDLIDRINAIFREVFDDDGLVVTPEMTANDIEEWDSLSHIRLIVAHEIKFGVKFNTIELNGLKNVGNFIDLLKSKLD